MRSTLRNFVRILTPAERRQGIRLAGLMLLAMVLEAAGVGLVLPLVAMLVEPDAPIVAPVLARAGHPPAGVVLLAGLSCLFVFTAVKAIYLGWTHRRLNRFIYAIQASLSYRLFEAYLTQPWSALAGRNSAELVRNIVTEVNHFVTFVALPIAALVAEGLVLCGLTALLVVLEPQGTITMLIVIGACGFAYQRGVGPHLVRAGRASQLHDGLRIQHIQQGLGGAKEVKLLGKEQAFLALYAEHNIRSARAGEYHLTALQAPRILLEALALASLTVLVAVLYLRGASVATMTGVAALFGAAAVKLLPSLNRIFGALQSLRYGTPAAALLSAELDGATPEPADGDPEARLAFDEVVRMEDVTFTYPGAETPALRSMSLAVRAGECVGLAGPSGSGKSTAVDVLLGLLAPQSGRVLVDGVDIQTNLRGWRRQTGYVPQTSYLTDDTLRRNVAFGVPDDDIDDTRLWAALRDAQLEPFVRTLPGGLETMVGERGVKLSGGQRQRVGIARALYRNARMLVLDEPTSALDTSTEQELMDAIRALHGRTTVLLVAHRPSTIAHCDRVYRVDHGQADDGSEAPRAAVAALTEC